jgi:hypothetical protein
MVDARDESTKPTSRPEHFRGARRWVVELSGLPTYVGGILLTKKMSGGAPVEAIVFLSIVVAYHYLYAYLFPKLEFHGHALKLFTVVLAQVCGWTLILWAIHSG